MRSTAPEEFIDKALSLIKSFQVDYQKSIVRQERIWKNEKVDRIPLLLQSYSVKEIDDFPHSTGPMISPDSIREIFLPGMKKLSDFIQKRKVRVMSHNCGNNWKIMDILIEAGV